MVAIAGQAGLVGVAGLVGWPGWLVWLLWLGLLEGRKDGKRERGVAAQGSAHRPALTGRLGLQSRPALQLARRTSMDKKREG